jgi:hypothetical protein
MGLILDGGEGSETGLKGFSHDLRRRTSGEASSILLAPELEHIQQSEVRLTASRLSPTFSNIAT